MGLLMRTGYVQCNDSAMPGFSSTSGDAQNHDETITDTTSLYLVDVHVLPVHVIASPSPLIHSSAGTAHRFFPPKHPTQPLCSPHVHFRLRHDSVEGGGGRATVTTAGNGCGRGAGRCHVPSQSGAARSGIETPRPHATHAAAASTRAVCVLGMARLRPGRPLLPPRLAVSGNRGPVTPRVLSSGQLGDSRDLLVVLSVVPAAVASCSTGRQ